VLFKVGKLRFLPEALPRTMPELTFIMAFETGENFKLLSNLRALKPFPPKLSQLRRICFLNEINQIGNEPQLGL
jgi:hypothetical protein